VAKRLSYIEDERCLKANLFPTFGLIVPRPYWNIFSCFLQWQIW